MNTYNMNIPDGISLDVYKDILYIYLYIVGLLEHIPYMVNILRYRIIRIVKYSISN